MLLRSFYYTSAIKANAVDAMKGWIPAWDKALGSAGGQKIKLLYALIKRNAV